MPRHSHRGGDALVHVLVGPSRREFVVHRRLLCAGSAFFRESLEGVDGAETDTDTDTPILWLAGESAGMFELFVLWLYRGHAFRTVVDEATTVLAAGAPPDEEIVLLAEDTTAASPLPSPPPSPPAPSPSARACSDLHWHLVHVHLFAARADMPALQDAAMDTLQDLYLRFDWEATPRLLRFLYACADLVAVCRLRKWAVALLAWTLSNGGGAKGGCEGEGEDESDVVTYTDTDTDTDTCSSTATSSLYGLLWEFPALRADYDAHLAKMAASTADVRIKNPQLRIPSNHLRRDDRHFGFRQCSFHSHRRSVGQGRCPHSLVLREEERRRAERARARRQQEDQERQDRQRETERRRLEEGQEVQVQEPVEPMRSMQPMQPMQPLRHSHSLSHAQSRPHAYSLSHTARPLAHVHQRHHSSGAHPGARLAASSLHCRTTSEPRLVDLPVWSPLSVTTPGLAPLGLESTI